MKLKIIFGIIVPSILIVILAILGSLNIGFSVKETYTPELSLSRDILDNGLLKNAIEVGEIDIDNDYLFSKRYNLPPLRACLIDTSKTEDSIEAGTIEYGEGDLVLTDGLTYYGRNSEKNVQIGSYGEKTVNIYLMPSSTFTYMDSTELTSKYGKYDELIIYEDKGNQRGIYYAYSTYCFSLDDKTIEDAVRIRIVP